MVLDGNTGLDAKTGLLRPQFKPATKPDRESPVTTLGDEAGKLVNGWWKDGTAAGHHGDLYDNRDGDHSDLDAEAIARAALEIAGTICVYTNTNIVVEKI